MSIFLVLDALLLLLIALFMPIGYWRGPVKELCVTLGLLLGMQLVDYWARPWGGDLADLTDLTSDGGAFVVAMCFLVGATFIIGYGVGAALGPSWPSFQSRVLGAAIAAFNGMLLLSFALQQVRLFLLSDENEESLEDAFVARFLLDQMGWVVLVVAIVAVPAILYILLSGRRAYELIEQPEPTWDATENADYPPRAPRVPRVPVQVDDDDDEDVPYKADPIPTPTRDRATDLTRQVQVTRPQETAEPVQPSRADARRTMQTRSDAEPAVSVPAIPQSVDEPVHGSTDPQMPIVSSAGTTSRVADDDLQPVPPPPPPTPAASEDVDVTADAAGSGNDSQSAGSGRRLRRPRNSSTAAVRDSEPPSDDSLPEGWQRCRTCHAVLPPGVGICPNCGTVRS